MSVRTEVRVGSVREGCALLVNRSLTADADLIAPAITMRKHAERRRIVARDRLDGDLLCLRHTRRGQGSASRRAHRVGGRC